MNRKATTVTACAGAGAKEVENSPTGNGEHVVEQPRRRLPLPRHGGRCDWASSNQPPRPRASSHTDRCSLEGARRTDSTTGAVRRPANVGVSGRAHTHRAPHVTRSTAPFGDNHAHISPRGAEESSKSENPDLSIGEQDVGAAEDPFPLLGVRTMRLGDSTDLQTGSDAQSHRPPFPAPSSSRPFSPDSDSGRDGQGPVRDPTRRQSTRSPFLARWPSARWPFHAMARPGMGQTSPRTRTDHAANKSMEPSGRTWSVSPADNGRCDGASPTPNLHGPDRLDHIARLRTDRRPDTILGRGHRRPHLGPVPRAGENPSAGFDKQPGGAVEGPFRPRHTSTVRLGPPHQPPRPWAQSHRSPLPRGRSASGVTLHGDPPSCASRRQRASRESVSSTAGALPGTGRGLGVPRRGGLPYLQPPPRQRSARRSATTRSSA